MNSKKRTLCALIVLCLAFSMPFAPLTPAHAEPTAKKLWQYGNGVIQDVDWLGDKIILAASTGLWQLDSAFKDEPTQFSDPGFGRSPTAAETGRAWTNEILSSPDGTRFLTQDDDNNVRIRDAHTSAPLLTLADQGSVRNLTWQPTGNLLAMVYYDKDDPSIDKIKVALLDAHTGQRVALIGDYANGITALSWSPDGQLLAVRLDSGKILIIKVGNQSVVHELSADRSAASVLMWSPDGTKLATTANNTTGLTLWRTDTFQPLTTPSFSAGLMLFAWHSDSKTLALAWHDGSVSTWNMDTGELKIVQSKPNEYGDRFVTRLAWHGDLLATLDYIHHLRIWDTLNNRLIWESSAFPGDADGLAVTKNGALVAIAYGKDAQIVLLDGQSGTLQQTLVMPSIFDVSSMRWNLASDELAVGTTLILYLWRFSPGLPPQLIQVNNMLQPMISWSPTDTLAVVWQQMSQEELRFIDGRTGAALAGTRQIPWLSDIRWSPNGRFIAMSNLGNESDGGSMRIDVLNIQTNQTSIVKFPFYGISPALPGEAFEWLPDSSGVVGFLQQGSFWRWNINDDMAKILIIGEHTNPGVRLSISYHDLAVFTAGDLSIISVTDGAPILTLSDLATVPPFFGWSDTNTLFLYDSTVQAYSIQS